MRRWLTTSTGVHTTCAATAAETPPASEAAAEAAGSATPRRSTRRSWWPRAPPYRGRAPRPRTGLELVLAVVLRTRAAVVAAAVFTVQGSDVVTVQYDGLQANSMSMDVHAPAYAATRSFVRLRRASDRSAGGGGDGGASGGPEGEAAGCDWHWQAMDGNTCSKLWRNANVARKYQLAAAACGRVAWVTLSSFVLAGGGGDRAGRCRRVPEAAAEWRSSSEPMPS